MSISCPIIIKLHQAYGDTKNSLDVVLNSCLLFVNSQNKKVSLIESKVELVVLSLRQEMKMCKAENQKSGKCEDSRLQIHLIFYPPSLLF